MESIDKERILLVSTSPLFAPEYLHWISKTEYTDAIKQIIQHRGAHTLRPIQSLTIFTPTAKPHGGLHTSRVAVGISHGFVASTREGRAGSPKPSRPVCTQGFRTFEQRSAGRRSPLWCRGPDKHGNHKQRGIQLYCLGHIRICVLHPN